MQIRELTQLGVTPNEAEQLAALHTLAGPGRLPSDPPMPPQLAIDGLRPSVGTMAFDYYGMFDGDRLVGYAETYGTVDAENAELCEIDLVVDPGADTDPPTLHRRLFDHIVEVERGRGRTRFWGWGSMTDGPTRSFWEDELGYVVAYDERISRCPVGEVDPALMQTWIDRASERAGGYELIRAIAPFDDHQAGLLAQGMEAMNDAPVDDLVYEKETYDIDRARQVEQVHLSSRSQYRAIFAVDSTTGELGGYTAVRIPDAEPSHAKQSDTVTVAAHRNRGIGRWMKASMWQWLRAERPEVVYLDTGNAESNRAMLAINEAMGFADVLHLGVWQESSEQN